MELKFSTALITGASGFIGQNLLKQLNLLGCQTLAIARSQHLNTFGSEIIISPLKSEIILEKLNNRKFDVVFHLAAYGVKPNARDPENMFATNIEATKEMVKLSAALGAKVFIYSGSCSEYKTQHTFDPIREESELDTDDLYGSSKAAAGLFGQSLAQKLGINFMWMRLFGTYGWGEGQDRLIPYLTQSLLQEKTALLTKGEQWRDMLYIDDVIRGLILAANMGLFYKQGISGPFNLCSGKPIQVKEIAEYLARLLNKTGSFLNFGALDYRPFEKMWMVGSPERFNSISGFKPTLSLEQGLERYLSQVSSELLN